MLETKYKVTLLKDLPDLKAGTELLNVTKAELDEQFTRREDAGGRAKLLKYLDHPDWVRVEEDPRCDCLTKSQIVIRHESVGYGRSLYVSLEFESAEIYTSYARQCDKQEKIRLSITHCPLCGRKL